MIRLMDGGEHFGPSVLYMQLMAPNDFADPWLFLKQSQKVKLCCFQNNNSVSDIW